MNDTKEKILLTALRLFASHGYEAASVSEIAAELGLTKGALYKHFRSKRDIFDCILRRMQEQDSERALAFGVPEKAFDETPEDYESARFESIRRFTLAQFDYWTQDSFAASFRRMLTIEQYRSREMQALYQNYLVSGPLGYVEDLFRTRFGENAAEAALRFYGPVLLLISACDGTDGIAGLRLRAAAHIEGFT